MSSIIDQADSIVGINPRATGLDEKSSGWLRIGAYIDWLTDINNAIWPNDAFDRSMSVDDMAGHIVRLHAASKPKGDGLPDDWQVRVAGVGAFCVRVSPSNDAVGFERSTADAVAKHLSRCLAPPVRRLLAAFDVVDGPYSSGVWFVVTKDGRIHTVNDIAYGAYVLTDVVCSLVPKGAK